MLVGVLALQVVLRACRSAEVSLVVSDASGSQRFLVTVRAQPRILLVEDEPAIRTSVVAALEDAGYRVVALADGGTLDSELEEFRPDLAVLDVMLPGADGLALARRLRRAGNLPILFLTARDARGDRLAGFDAGGDDYVVKPFDLDELLARVRALLRRAGALESETIEVGDLLVDERAGAARRAGRPLALTPTEWKLLVHLARNRGRTLSKVQLLAHVWGYEAYDPNVVEVHVSGLRRKLEEHGPRLLHTVRGLGYTVREP